MEKGLVARNGGWIGLGALVAILALGLGLRLSEACDGQAPVYDAQAYAAIAANLEEGNGFTVGQEATQPSSNYSPGLPLLVAGIYEVTGGVDERLARVLLAVVGALSILFAYAIGRRLTKLVAGGAAAGRAATGRIQRTLKKRPYGGSNSAGAEFWPALVGALVVAVYPALLEYQGMLMSEPLAATLLSGGVLAMLWAGEGGWVRWVLPGALLGALALVRPEYLGVAMLLGVAVFARQAWSDWRRSLLRTAIFLGALALIVLPWTLRNAIALDRFVPISTGGGQVLFAGTYLPSGGDPEKVGEGVVADHPQLFAPQDAQRLRLEQILARLAAARYPGFETDRALSKLGKEQLWEDLSGTPLDYTRFVAAKVWRIWSHGPRDVMQEPGWELLHWALVGLGLFGLAILAWQRRWEALLLATIFLAITAISALLVASPRRVLVLVPLLAALAATALAWLSPLLGSPSAGRLSKPGRAADGPSPRPDSLGRP